MNEKFKNIGLGICGSFCTHNEIIKQIKILVEKGYNVIPIMSNATKCTDTRFGMAEDFYNLLYEITGNVPIDSIVGAEPLGPKNLIDVFVVAPCTGNTVSKLYNAMSDNAVTMTAKSHIRNNKPVIIGISTNDGLGLNLKNIAGLLNTKNFYFIPFGQDDPIKKPKSLIADWNLIEETISEAVEGKQIQPILIKK